MDYIKLLTLLAFLNSLIVFDMIIFYKLRKKKDKPLTETQYNDSPLVEEYEEEYIDEFDERIQELKSEIVTKRNEGSFEVNQAEIITEEYEQELYKSVM